jgi:hypothetical protein
MRWDEIDPADAQGLDLSVRFDIVAPHNENGERCPWPWEPQLLCGLPIGQYHCGHCGAVVVAGLPHLDYRDLGNGDIVGGAIIPPCPDIRRDR